MKQAILITAYKSIEPILELIELFSDGFNFYVHVDQKANLDTTPLQALRHVKVYSRYTVNWGGLNHLKAILLLAKEALLANENDFFHLITAEDYPIKPKEAFLKLDTSNNYISYTSLPSPYWQGNGGLDRIEYYNPYDWWNARSTKGYSRLQNILRWQIRLRYKRPFKTPIAKKDLFGGSGYWSLNRNALQYVMDYTHNHPTFFRRCRYTLCPEEFYFHSVLANSLLSSTLVNDNLRFMDWSVMDKGGPAYLDESHFEKIRQSSALFARKINDEHSWLLKKALRRHLTETARQ